MDSNREPLDQYIIMEADGCYSHTYIPRYTVAALGFVSRDPFFRDRLRNLEWALFRARALAPRYVEEETGEILGDVLKGIIPALLTACAALAAATLLGAGVGAVVGFFFGGVGALPGGAAGAKVGFQVGVVLLKWLGLGFLVAHVGRHLHQVGYLIQSGFRTAWGSNAIDRDPGTPFDADYRPPTAWNPAVPDDFAVDRAADKFARAVAVLVRLTLEGVVLYLTAKGVSRLPAVVARLKKSRFGVGFALWVQQNHQRLMQNPKLNGSATKAGAAQPVRVLDHSGVPEQPRPGRRPIHADRLPRKPQLRLEYEKKVLKLKEKALKLKESGRHDEEIARALHAERRALGVKFKNITPPEILEKIYQRNLEKYGDPLGPSIELLRSRGKTWTQIIESACRPGGSDLGF